MSLDKPLTRNVRPERAPTDLREYEANGGYQALHQTVGKLSSADCLQLIKDSNIPHIALDLTRARQPECFEVTIICKPSPFSTSSTMGWKLKDFIDKYPVVPFGVVPGTKTDFGVAIILNMQPWRTQYEEDMGKLV